MDCAGWRYVYFFYYHCSPYILMRKGSKGPSRSVGARNSSWLRTAGSGTAQSVYDNNIQLWICPPALRPKPTVLYVQCTAYAENSMNQFVSSSYGHELAERNSIERAAMWLVELFWKPLYQRTHSAKHGSSTCSIEHSRASRLLRSIIANLHKPGGGRCSSRRPAPENTALGFLQIVTALRA